MDVIRFVIAIPFLGIWLLISLFHGFICVRNIIRRIQEGPSPLMIVGSLAGLIGWFLVPSAYLSIPIPGKILLGIIPDLITSLQSWFFLIVRIIRK